MFREELRWDGANKKIRLHLLVQLMVMIFIRQIHMFNSNGKKMVELTYVPVQDFSTKITEWRFVLKFNMAAVVTIKSTAVQSIFLDGEKKSIQLKRI